MPCPRAALAPEWDTLGDDALGFLDVWGERAAALGWPSWALFGIHATVPHSFHGRELVALLGGPSYSHTASATVVDLTADAATIRTTDGSRLVYRLRARDPLHPTERSLLWELRPIIRRDAR